MTVTPILKILFDFICFLLVAIPFFITHRIIRPFKRGFYCDDESIRYPYRSSTVSNPVLLLGAFGLPIISILLIEWLHFCYIKNRKCTTSTKIIANKTIHPYIWHSYIKLGVFLFGFFINGALTFIGKYTIGYLRPYFIDVCRPNVMPEPCHHMYIENYTCMGKNLDHIFQGRQSFPSGHASLSAYSMVYLVIYLQSRIKWQASILLKPFLQFLAVSMAFYIGLTRISDHHHHWSDVLAGLALGTVVAILITYFVSDLIKCYKKKAESVETPTKHILIPKLNATESSKEYQNVEVVS